MIAKIIQGAEEKKLKSKFISLQVRFYTRVLTFCKEEKKRGRNKERDLTKKERERREWAGLSAIGRVRV